MIKPKRNDTICINKKLFLVLVAGIALAVSVILFSSMSNQSTPSYQSKAAPRATPIINFSSQSSSGPSGAFSSSSSTGNATSGPYGYVYTNKGCGVLSGQFDRCINTVGCYYYVPSGICANGDVFRDYEKCADFADWKACGSDYRCVSYDNKLGSFCMNPSIIFSARDQNGTNVAYVNKEILMRYYSRTSPPSGDSSYFPVKYNDSAKNATITFDFGSTMVNKSYRLSYSCDYIKDDGRLKQLNEMTRDPHRGTYDDAYSFGWFLGATCTFPSKGKYTVAVGVAGSDDAFATGATPVVMLIPFEVK